MMKVKELLEALQQYADKFPNKEVQVLSEEIYCKITKAQWIVNEGAFFSEVDFLIEIE